MPGRRPRPRPGPARGLDYAAGTLPAGTLLRVDVAEVVLADETRTVDVDVDVKDYATC